MISIFEDSLKSGKDIKIYGDGEQTRDFVFIEDVIDANIKAMTTECDTGIIINIATGHQCTINDLLKIMCNLLDVNFTPSYEPARQGDIRYSYADITQAEQIIAWKPTIKLEQGLQKYLNAP